MGALRIIPLALYLIFFNVKAVRVTGYDIPLFLLQIKIYYRTIRRFTADGNHTEIQKIISILSSEFALSQNPNSKKGGLIGLAACAIALGCQVIL